MPSLLLYDASSERKREFLPISTNKIGLYVCGPTVYSYPHIGNARSVVVYDILYRILLHLYPKVVYVRNITDVDDKIINAAVNKGVSIAELSDFYSKSFCVDVAKIFCLTPDFEPRATDNITQMIDMIQLLIQHGNAYITQSGVYFSVASFADYGALSGRTLNELFKGVRIDYKSKANECDFVLWKLDENYGWPSPWGKGRPGWHIECSTMSTKYLGRNFDIHGGGVDLKFPHHENEIAQSCCAYPGSRFAKYWVHNGFVTVDGEKMSKSKGNHLELHALLDYYPAEVIRYCLISTHYRKPIDWNKSVVENAFNALNKFYHAIKGCEQFLDNDSIKDVEPSKDFLAALLADLNLPEALSILHSMCSKINANRDKIAIVELFKANCNLIGILNMSSNEWFGDSSDQEINDLVNMRLDAKKNRDYPEADRIKGILLKRGIIVQDTPTATSWYRQRNLPKD